GRLRRRPPPPQVHRQLPAGRRQPGPPSSRTPRPARRRPAAGRPQRPRPPGLGPTPRRRLRPGRPRGRPRRPLRPRHHPLITRLRVLRASGRTAGKTTRSPFPWCGTIPHHPRSDAEAAATPRSRPGPGSWALAAATRRLAAVHVLPGLEHLVARAPRAVGRPAVVGPPGGPCEPYAELADAAGGKGAEDVAGEGDVGVREAAHGRRVTRAAVPGVVVLRIDGEPTAGDQVVADPDVMGALQGVPDPDGPVP